MKLCCNEKTEQEVPKNDSKLDSLDKQGANINKKSSKDRGEKDKNKISKEKTTNGNDCCENLGNAPVKEEPETLGDYYARFFEWLTSRTCLQGYAWIINANWLNIKHPHHGDLSINIGFSGGGNQYKVFKVEIYVTNNNDARWNSFMSWLQQNPKKLVNLYRLPKDHQHTHSRATSETKGHIGTYAIRPSPLQSPQSLIYNGRPLQSGHYGRINQIQSALAGSVSFGHAGGDRRLVTWHKNRFRLNQQQDVNELAKWACKTFKIFYSVFSQYQ